jgi:hypothetical protein
LSDKPSLQDLLEVQKYFGLPSAALVEKDRYVVKALAREIMSHAAEVFGNQFPAYRANPLVETLRAVAALEADPAYARRYADFRRDMVYGDRIGYTACIGTLQALPAQLHKGNR